MLLASIAPPRAGAHRPAQALALGPTSTRLSHRTLLPVPKSPLLRLHPIGSRNSVAACAGKAKEALQLPPEPPGGWRQSVRVYCEHKDDPSCRVEGELDVYRFAMFWRGGTGAKAFEGCISDVQKVSKATGEVLEYFPPEPMSISDFEACAGRAAHRKPRENIKLAQPILNFQEGAKLDVFLNTFGLEKKKREKGTALWKEKQKKASPGAAGSASSSSATPQRPTPRKGCWPQELYIQTKPLQPPPTKRKGRLAIYAQNKDWVLKGKLNVNLCLQYPKNVEKGQPTPPKWHGRSAIKDVVRENIRTGEVEPLNKGLLSPTMLFIESGHCNVNKLVLSELLVRPPWIKEEEGGKGLIPLSQYLAEHGVDLPLTHTLPPPEDSGYVVIEEPGDNA